MNIIRTTNLKSRTILRLGPGPLLTGNTSTFRCYATPSKKKQTADISQIPIKSIGVIGDFYVPPKFSSSPILSWPRLVLRRLGAFGINTYNIVKFRQETKLKLTFNDWKEDAMSKFVKTNKIFASACNLPMSQRKQYLILQLEGNTGSLVTQKLIERALTFPNNGKLSWELLSVEKNPKITTFTILPDSNNITTYVQLVIKVTTKQSVSYASGIENKTSERTVSDNLVFSLNPFSDELVWVGTIFDSNHIRGIQPEIAFDDVRLMQQFQNQSSDVFRSPE